MSIDEKIRELVAQEVSTQLPALISHLATDEGSEEMQRIASQVYLKKREAALYLNVSEGHIDNLIAEDPTFPVSRLGKLVRFKREELEEYARDQGRPKLRPVRKSVTSRSPRL